MRKDNTRALRWGAAREITMKKSLTILALGLFAWPALAQSQPPPASASLAASSENLAREMEDMRAEMRDLRNEVENLRASGAQAPAAAPPGRVTSRSITLTSSDYTVAADERVGGDVRAVSGDIIVLGTVMGDVSTVSGDVEVKGIVTGNVASVSGDITLAGTARVMGDVQTLSGNIRRLDGAEVGGSLRGGRPRGGAATSAAHSRTEAAMFQSAFNLPIFFTILLAGMVLLVVMPQRVDTVGRAFVNRPGHSFIVGLASVPVLVLAIILSAITIVLPILLSAGYVLAFLMGVSAIALMLGRRMAAGRRYKSRFYPLLIGLLVWLAANVISHVATPLLVLMSVTTSIAYVMAVGAALTTGFGKSPFWLRDRMAGRRAVAVYGDPAPTYAGSDTYGDVI